jgi:Conserved hypothetical protein (Lin0512_fam)
MLMWLHGCVLQGSVDVSEVRQVFPHGRVAVEVVDGGLRAPHALENGIQHVFCGAHGVIRLIQEVKPCVCAGFLSCC